MSRKRSPFYKVAKYLASTHIADLNLVVHCCCGLLDQETAYDRKYKDFFAKYFEPSCNDRVEYNHDLMFWMISHDYYYQGQHKKIWEDRIMALLFADLLWKDHEK